MAWKAYYHGDGSEREVDLDAPPPWRVFPRQPLGLKFQPPPGLTTAVNAALSLRRPLLLTGMPGSGKSTVIESVAQELRLEPVLRWHVTSRSELKDALYSYDVLGRIHAQQLAAAGLVETTDAIAPFMQLGPLGTALLPSERPRALLIDEIDKGDLDLPSDLLNILERGEYEIPELVRYREEQVPVRMWGTEETWPVKRGKVACAEFPFIVMTSNEEREFPPAFLRRCIRFDMPPATEGDIRRIVHAHLDMDVPETGPLADLVKDFAERLKSRQNLAIDQLLNAVFVLADTGTPDEGQRKALVELLTRELIGA